MFCPNCGTQQPDGTAFCGACGSALNPAPQPITPEPVPPVAEPVPPAPEPVPPAPEPVQPYYAPTNAKPVEVKLAEAPVPPANPVSRKVFLKQAPLTTKLLSWGVLLTMVACLVVLVGSYMAPLETPIFEIPVMSVAVDAAGELGGDLDVDELEDTLDEAYDEAVSEYHNQQYYYDEYQDVYVEMDDDTMDAIEDTLDAMKDFIKDMSILSARNFLKVADDSRKELDEQFEVMGFVDEMGVGDDILGEDTEEMIDTLNNGLLIIMGVIALFFLLPLIFTLVAGFKRSKGMTITALIFILISQLVFSGFTWMLYAVLAYGAQIALCVLLNVQYDRYLAGRIRI